LRVTDPTARVILARNVVVGLYNGIMLSSSRSATIEVRANLVRYALFEGIFVIGTNDAVIRGNTVTDNDGDGIDVLEGSSNNLIVGNTATGNSPDLIQEDAGVGNCFLNNTYETWGGFIGCSHSQ
jgi:parallel beta-helix repeat protein